MNISPVQTRAREYLQKLPSDGSSIKRAEAAKASVDQLVREFPDEARISRVARSMSEGATHINTRESLLRQALELTATGGHSVGNAALLMLDEALDQKEKLKLAEAGFHTMRNKGYIQGPVAGLVNRYGSQETKLVAIKAQGENGRLKDFATAQELYITAPKPALGRALLSTMANENPSLQLAEAMIGGFGIFTNKARKRGVTEAFLNGPEPKTLADGARLAAVAVEHIHDTYKEPLGPMDLLGGMPRSEYVSYGPAKKAGLKALDFLQSRNPADGTLAKLVRTSLKTVDQYSYNMSNVAEEKRNLISAGLKHMGESELTPEKMAQTVGSLSDAFPHNRRTEGIIDILDAAAEVDLPYQSAFRAASTIVGAYDYAGSIYQGPRTLQSMMSTLAQPGSHNDPVREIAGVVLDGKPLKAVDDFLAGNPATRSDDDVTRAVWKAFASEAKTEKERNAARELLKA
jgi:hypothetical protein